MVKSNNNKEGFWREFTGNLLQAHKITRNGTGEIVKTIAKTKYRIKLCSFDAYIDRIDYDDFFFFNKIGDGVSK